MNTYENKINICNSSYQLMVIERNCETNDKRPYKEKSLNFIYVYRNHINILR